MRYISTKYLGAYRLLFQIMQNLLQLYQAKRFLILDALLDSVILVYTMGIKTLTQPVQLSSSQDCFRYLSSNSVLLNK